MADPLSSKKASSDFLHRVKEGLSSIDRSFGVLSTALSEEDANESGEDSSEGGYITEEQQAEAERFSAYWVRDRQALWPTLTQEQRRSVLSQMTALYGGLFYHNEGSWGTEGEAVWIIFNKYREEKNSNNINFAEFWENRDK